MRPSSRRDAEPAESPYMAAAVGPAGKRRCLEKAGRRLGEGWHRNRRDSLLFSSEDIVVCFPIREKLLVQ